MCCCRSQIAIDYMKFCFNPLCLVYVPAPCPPPPAPAPPPLSQAWSLSPHCVRSYTWYTGVSQNNFLRQNTRHPTLKKSFQSSFFLPLCIRTFLQHPLPKMLFFFHRSMTRESFSDFSLPLFFHLCLTNAGYLCQRTFWNLPV